ncbi:MAG: hypothetical protein ACI97A_000388 [Planctomycetota bacterium]|jgi:hypothetical protein
MFSKRILLGLIITLAALISPLQAAWVQVDLFSTGNKTYAKKDGVTGYWNKSYKIKVSPSSISGVGEARAKSLSESVVYSHSPKKGIHFELWRHLPPGVGEIEVRVLAAVSTENQTKGPGLGKSATLAYCRGDYWLDDARDHAEALVTNGAHNTRVEGLPTFTLGLDFGIPRVGGVSVGTSIPIAWFSGSGLIMDADLDYIADFACPVKKFRYRTISKASVFIWAKGSSGGKGQAFCKLTGGVSVRFVLITHAMCPTR